MCGSEENYRGIQSWLVVASEFLGVNVPGRNSIFMRMCKLGIWLGIGVNTCLYGSFE